MAKEQKSGFHVEAYGRLMPPGTKIIQNGDGTVKVTKPRTPKKSK